MQTLLIMIFFAGIGMFLFEKMVYKKLGIEEYLLLIVPLVFLVIFYLRGKQIFEYDSDGEGLTIKNRHILPYFHAPVSDEFPKYKLLSYNIVDAFILKRLYISIKRKNNSSLILKYDISNLTKKEVDDMKHSLSKIINNNKKAPDFKSQEIE